MCVCVVFRYLPTTRVPLGINLNGCCCARRESEPQKKTQIEKKCVDKIFSTITVAHVSQQNTPKTNWTIINLILKRQPCGRRIWFRCVNFAILKNHSCESQQSHWQSKSRTFGLYAPWASGTVSIDRNYQFCSWKISSFWFLIELIRMGVLKRVRPANQAGTMDRFWPMGMFQGTTLFISSTLAMAFPNKYWKWHFSQNDFLYSLAMNPKAAFKWWARFEFSIATIITIRRYLSRCERLVAIRRMCHIKWWKLLSFPWFFFIVSNRINDDSILFEHFWWLRIWGNGWKTDFSSRFLINNRFLEAWRRMLVQIFPNLFQFPQKLSEFARIYPNLPKFDQICPKPPEFTQISLSFCDQVCMYP